MSWCSGDGQSTWLLDNPALDGDGLQLDRRKISCEEGQSSPFGRKFEIRATIEGPSGKTARINTVWIIEDGTTSPRFVTAYPS